MTKESKGQRVKSFTFYVPISGGRDDAEKTTVVVYFQAKENRFAAYLPQHIADAIGNHPDAPEKLWHGAIVSPLADDIEPGFKAACDLYRKIQRNSLRKKVLLINIDANHPKANKYVIGMEEGYPAFKDISFTHSPALAMSYQVMWQVGDGLYRSYHRDKDSDLEEMTYVCTVPDTENRYGRSRFLIDWTEDREALVENIRGGLITLIERLWQLLSGDTGANVDRLISGGGSLMLPAPQPTEGEDA
jgi:hypothetical protein